MRLNHIFTCLKKIIRKFINLSEQAETKCMLGKKYDYKCFSN